MQAAAFVAEVALALLLQASGPNITAMGPARSDQTQIFSGPASVTKWDR